MFAFPPWNRNLIVSGHCSVLLIAALALFKRDGISFVARKSLSSCSSPNALFLSLSLCSALLTPLVQLVFARADLAALPFYPVPEWNRVTIINARPSLLSGRACFIGNSRVEKNWVKIKRRACLKIVWGIVAIDSRRPGLASTSTLRDSLPIDQSGRVQCRASSSTRNQRNCLIIESVPRSSPTA